MNTVTHQEVHALEAAVPAQHMLLVPLSRLRFSKRNVRTIKPGSRKARRKFIRALAASLQHVGLLQNLTVIPCGEVGDYEVVAGSGRLEALQLLASKQVIAADYQVPCLLVADASARTASLTENVLRESMGLVAELRAWQALVDEGRTVEAIAADFGVAPLVVRRRLRLANVSPRLLASYEAEDEAESVSVEQLMALAITDDHAAQEAAFFDAPHWQRSPQALRARLTEREIDAHRHPLARFVGLAAYEAAGGGVRRDLFADDDSGVYLTDAALLDQLAQAKLEAVAEEARGEGWGWIDVAPSATAADLRAFERAPKEARPPSAREAKRIAKLQENAQAVEQALQEAIDAEDEDKADALYEEGQRIEEQVAALDAGRLRYSPAVRGAAGVIVTLDHEGQPVLHRGLLREAEAKALRALAKEQHDERQEANEEAPEAKKASQSEKLTRRLSAHHTAALQIELARHPQAALAALVHGMVQQVLQNGYALSLPIGVTARPQDRLDGYAPDLPQSPAVLALQEQQQAWTEKLPSDNGELFALLLAMPQDELVQLLAVCVAATVDVVTSRAQDVRGAALAQAIGLDMRAWWTPTAEGYFNHVSKAVILQAVQQFAPASVTRLSKLKKADIAREAERLAVGTGWMPAMFADQRVATEPETGSEGDTHENAAEANEAGAAAVNA